MVTGKRDFLSNDAKDLIREAGIFHIITISGVQMTLVAGIFFWRRGACSRCRRRWRCAIRSRNGRRRSPWSARSPTTSARARASARSARLIMTLIVLGAVIVDRRALTMRNLALRGAGRRRAGARGDARRQLPALVRRGRRAGRGAGGAACARRRAGDPFVPPPARAAKRGALSLHLVDKPLGLLVATLCATARPPRSWPIISTTSAPMC